VIAWTLAEIAETTGGRVADDVPGAADVVVTGPAFIDSREVVAGGLFAAFVGEQVDGHDFAAGAVEAGAAAVLGSRPVGVPAVLVEDPRAALQALARRLLSELPDLTVIALTGSQGKTTTKDMLASVLASAGATVATQGSFNNELGLPLTVLHADPSTRFLVLEMGARGIGHLTELCAIARPDVSLVLNVGKAHIGEFGTQDDIARAKGELVEALPAEGTAVLNADDPRVAAMASRTEAAVTTYGRDGSADVRVVDERLEADGCPSFRLVQSGQTAEVRLRLLGAHQVSNAAGAAAVAVTVGMPLVDAAAALGEVTSLSRWRMEMHERGDGLLVLNDAYNANPDSMAAALRALVAVARGRGARPVAVLGEMLELGESAPEEHRAVGRLAVELGVTRVVGVGPVAADVVRGAEDALGDQAGSGADSGSRSEQGTADQGEEPVRVADNEAAVAWLRDSVGAGDVVLVKASRGAALDRVADALLADGLAEGDRR
jgi:UDP-N-acetylmuramoyl-tripeptide--D-alanyl-D-alanine ligase